MSAAGHGGSPDPAPLDDAGRAELRRRRVMSMPRWYSPWLHLASTVGLGCGLAALSLTRLRGLQAWELAAIPLFFVFCNAVEWRAHRGLLHRRRRFLEAFYDRHTPVHHRVFVESDMAIRAPRELGFVLIPSYGIAGVFALTLPLALALGAAGQSNLASLFVATCMAYMVLYECLHLSYHLPPDSRIGRNRVVARLRRHHSAHHRPSLMRQWNFNVTFPLWDLVRGTYHRGGAADAATRDGRSGSALERLER